MRKLLVALLVFGSVSAAFGYDTNEAEVRWNGIAGVVTALNVDNLSATSGINRFNTTKG